MTLTDRFVQTIKPLDDRRADYSDGKVRGLVLRVTPAGAKSWALRYCRKSDGKQQRLTLGKYPAVSLYDARAKAQAFLTQVEKGEDPAKEEVRRGPRARVTTSRPRTFGELAERYIASYALHKRTGREDEQMLRNDVLPTLEGEPLNAIDRADVSAILDAIIARGSPIRANRTFAVIRKCFNWGLNKGFVRTTPVLGMKPPSKEASRERILSDDEIRIFWRRLPITAIEWELRILLKLALVTGQRVSEIAHANRAHVDLIKAEWFIPSERAKNERGHLVPLSPLAIRLFEKAIGRSDHAELILPRPSGPHPYLKSTPAKAIRRAQGINERGKRIYDDVLGFKEPMVPHDLRRTLASGLGRLGYSRLIQDKVLNHITGDRQISAVYDRYEYLKEKREALEAWGAHLEEIVFRPVSQKPHFVVRSSSTSSPWARKG